MHTTEAACLDGLYDTSLTANEGIGIAHPVLVVAMQIAQGYGAHQEQAHQREDGEHEELHVEATAESSTRGCKGGTDGEAEDEEIACRELQNQAENGYHRPHLPKVLC